MHFEFTLAPAAKTGVKANSLESWPSVTDGVVSNYVGYAHWVNAVGFAIINEVSLKFGSNIIDKHSGLWYDVWNELTDPTRKEWPLVGKFENNKLGARDITKTRYYVPLKFYFNRNPGLAIPIFLLNENELKINLSFASLNSLLNYQPSGSLTTSVDTTKKIENFKFYANYVFLEQEEESRIQNSLPSEYLVETLDIKDNITSSTSTNLVFDNPVKEFIWVFRHPDRIVEANLATNLVPRDNKIGETHKHPNDIFNYSKMNLNANLGYGSKDPFSKLTIQINNNDRFEQTDATFFRTMQPYKYHSNIPGGISKNEKKQFIYVYSFALNPEEYQPTGSYNFSIGDDLVSFSFTGPDADSEGDSAMSDYDLTIFAVRYEYIVFNYGRVTKSRVPIQTAFQEAQTEAPAAKKDSKGKPVKGTGTKGSAVAQEINRRYAREVTYKGDSTISKKKWSGLQGDFFHNQKNADLGRDSEHKKKDLF
jgi:hypothetical protein